MDALKRERENEKGIYNSGIAQPKSQICGISRSDILST